MVKTILLKLEEKNFFSLKEAKLRAEKKQGTMTWERFVVSLMKAATSINILERRNKHGNRKKTNI